MCDVALVGGVDLRMSVAGGCVGTAGGGGFGGLSPRVVIISSISDSVGVGS